MIAAATSGRTVLISGLTVIAAMAGLYFAGDPEFAGLATGSIVVVAMAMLGSLTVLPAMLSKLGDGIDRGRIPFLGKRMQRRTESRVWGAILRPVMRRPLVATIASSAVLIALAVPALGMHTASSGFEQLPDTPIMKTFDRMQKAFPGTADPGQVVIKADDVNSPEAKAAIADLDVPGACLEQLRARHHDRPQRERRGRDRQRPARRVRQRQQVLRRAGGAAYRDRPGHGRQAQGRRGRRRRQRRDVQGLQRHGQGRRPDRVRVRPHPRVPAPAGDVPLDRRPDQGDRAEPALRRRVLRRADADLPARLAAQAARLRDPRVRDRAGCRCSCS